MSRIGSVFVFFQYHRGGLQHSLLQLVASITKNGHYPFVILADFNCPPDALASTQWPDALDSEVLATGNSTCVQGESFSEIDYCLISRVLLPVVHSLEVSFVAPWGPHGFLKLTFNKSLERASRYMPYLVKKFKHVPKLVKNTSLQFQSETWDAVAPEAELQSQTFVSQHAHLPHHYLDSSSRLFKFTRHLELWCLSLESKVTKLDKDKYLGRALPLEYGWVPLVNSNNKSYQGLSNNKELGQHEPPAHRLLLFLQKVIIGTNRPTPKIFWVKQLQLLVDSFCFEFTPHLCRVLGFEKTSCLFVDLLEWKLAVEFPSIASKPPHFINKVQAFVNKTSRLLEISGQDLFKLVVKQWLDKGAGGAHKYCNAVNRAPKEATSVAKDGTLQVSSQVDDQCSAWSHEWCHEGNPALYTEFVEKIELKL